MVITILVFALIYGPIDTTLLLELQMEDNLTFSNKRIVISLRIQHLNIKYQMWLNLI
jgi:hypothetical protein